MSDETNQIPSDNNEEPKGPMDVNPEDHHDDIHNIVPLTGLYKDWFLDYASYVILERAVPHINDGLKPVQRRILHSMRRMDDGRYNKVANIIGHTMQFHPHGDASIGDALVQLGQKDLLVDCQGNWGNILTGDSAAAPRYIESRLSKFALDVIFNPKTTSWKPSYDGRNHEPVTLPVKFPLLLAQGVEGIAVGLASKILPHNFNELIEASIAYLKKQPFELYPDFPTGGLLDVARYNDGLRGGSIRVRAKISKLDKKTLVINEVPFGRTTSSLIESILKANEKGKIKIRKVDDNTAANVEILVHLAPGIDPDKTIDALFAFTDCEIPISPNACVIENDRPRFVGITEMLKISTDNTLNLLKRELEIRINELEEDWHMASLEKIFFEEKIYRELERNEDSWELVIDAVEKGFDPYRKLFRREITRDDVLKLTEKPVRKISRFDIKKADELIKGIETELEKVRYNLEHIVPYTIKYFEDIRRKYGKGRDRKTELRSFDIIEATMVVVANEKLYVNWEEGFAGTGLKKDEYICDCSD
ncbi:MAG TPA: DNA gyrase/topoisomerase IV subunit A, partial [Bacteroidales bacterium]|nr:DNA gyrase/topoisomerase IV subunit A [Bacteroidales bacterium]